jgi:hypothetical protein
LEIAQRELRSEVLVEAISDGDSLVKRLMRNESRVLRRTDQIGTRSWEAERGPTIWDRLRAVAG